MNPSLQKDEAASSSRAVEVRCPFSGSAHPFPGDLATRWDLALDSQTLVEPGREKRLELQEAARLAWRNSVRCIGRLHWKSLRVVDATSLEDPDSIFDALTHHLETATHGGRILPVMTVFAPWQGPESEIRVWNHQLVRYAAYEAADGSVLGDPMNRELTRVALSLGWKPPRDRTRFDLLPLIVQCGERVLMRELPREKVLEVPIRHPDHPWFEQLGLRWYAVPVLADRIFATGTEAYPCAPFNGWYMGTEIGARNLADEARYHQLPVIAEKLGLETKRRGSLWKDHALVVLNEAVIESFLSDGVQLVDHHQASREFIQFCENEVQAGRVPSADWSWIVPPLSGAATPVFHRQFQMQPELPNFLTQVPAWETLRGRALLGKYSR